MILRGRSFWSGSSYYLELAASQLLLIRYPRPASWLVQLKPTPLHPRHDTSSESSWEIIEGSAWENRAWEMRQRKIEEEGQRKREEREDGVRVCVCVCVRYAKGRRSWIQKVKNLILNLPQPFPFNPL